MVDVIFGGDINFMAVDKNSVPHIDENKLTQAMQSLTVENGGAITSFTLNSASVKR